MPGPWTGRILNQVVEWQLDHPTGNKEECSTWLQVEVAAGRIVLGNGRGTRGPTEPHPAKKAKLSKDR